MFSIALYVKSHKQPKGDQLKSAPSTPQEKKDAVVRDLALITLALFVTTTVLAFSNNLQFGLPLLGTFVVGWLTKTVSELELPEELFKNNQEKSPLGHPLKSR